MVLGLKLRIPKGEWVLVTGANSYIGSHVVDILLQEGYNVRGSVRKSRSWLNMYFDEKYGSGRFETCIVSSLLDKVAFLEAVQGMSGVIHVASDVSGTRNPNESIPNAVAGTINILEASDQSSSKSVKSIVLTSSIKAATLTSTTGPPVIISQDTWNDTALRAAWDPTTDPKDIPTIIYCASKTAAEQELWRWTKERRPGFVVNSVLPAYNVGATLIPQIPGNTMLFVRQLLEGNKLAIDLFPPDWWIDVRDTARLHVAALLDPRVESERLFACAGRFNWTKVISILKELRPEATLLPSTPKDEGDDVNDFANVGGRAEEIIRSLFGVPGWTSFEDSISAGIGVVNDQV